MKAMLCYHCGEPVSSEDGGEEFRNVGPVLTTYMKLDGQYGEYVPKDADEYWFRTAKEIGTNPPWYSVPTIVWAALWIGEYQGYT